MDRFYRVHFTLQITSQGFIKLMNMYILTFLSMTNFVLVLELIKGQTKKRITSNKSVNQIFFDLNYISEAVSQLDNPHSNHHEQKNTTIQSLSDMKNENEKEKKIESAQNKQAKNNLIYLIIQLAHTPQYCTMKSNSL